MKRVILLISLLPFFSIFPATEIGASTSLTYQYDANGNLIQGDGKYFEYNDASQLVRVRQGDANGPVIAQYFYDYQGQRIKKIENGVVTYYVGKHYVTQKDGNTVTSTNYYFANGERVAKKDSSGNISYYLSDHLGGTNDVIDNSGNLVERTTYYPFGDIRQGGSDRFTYTGKEKDKFTDSFYYEARYYNSVLKHFSQGDSAIHNVYDAQQSNRYSYTINNPMKFVDPDGHYPVGSDKWRHELIRAQQYDKSKYMRLLSHFSQVELGVQQMSTSLIDILIKEISKYSQLSRFAFSNPILLTDASDTCPMPSNTPNPQSSEITPDPEYAKDRNAINWLLKLNSLLSLIPGGTTPSPSGTALSTLNALSGGKQQSNFQRGINALTSEGPQIDACASASGAGCEYRAY